jgi:phosphodiesterase/alkaline phosphatase D-like protein
MLFINSGEPMEGMMDDHSPTHPRRTGLVGRRQVLTVAAGAAALLVAERIPGAWAAPRATGDRDLFSLGVASGEPTPTGVVLWTRLAPRPLDPDGGMPPRAVPVEWQVATGPSMTRVVASGRVLASPASAHSIHVQVDGLEPGRHYWYRFRAGGHLSRIGRTRTSPDPRRPLGRLDLAVVSCQSWEAGWYPAYRHLADDDVDVVLHLGDYIYENAPRPGRPRIHLGGEATDLAGYRARHALYKTDPDLQAAHARHPFVVTFDDHEVANNYAAHHPAQGGDPRAFLRRRAAAYRAAWEHLPLRHPPRGHSMPLYRRLRFGDLAEVNLLDTRQYRDDQPCNTDDGVVVTCPERTDKRRTILGERQRRWLLRSLDRSPARWNVLAQQVVMAEVDVHPGPRPSLGGRRLGRLRCRPGPAAALPVGAPARQPGGAHRRRPLLLRQRPAALQPRPRQSGGRHRVRRHLHQLRRRQLPGVPQAPARQSPGAVLRQPPPRLHPLHRHPPTLVHRPADGRHRHPPRRADPNPGLLRGGRRPSRRPAALTPSSRPPPHHDTSSDDDRHPRR